MERISSVDLSRGRMWSKIRKRVGPSSSSSPPLSPVIPNEFTSDRAVANTSAEVTLTTDRKSIFMGTAWRDGTLVDFHLPFEPNRSGFDDMNFIIYIYTIYIYYIRACNDQTLIVACLRSSLDNRMVLVIKIDRFRFVTEPRYRKIEGERGEEKYRKRGNRTESEIFYSRARSINRICIGNWV